MRTNPYLLPHKGLRNLLGKVSLLTGNVDSNSLHDLKKLKWYSNELFYLLEQHAKVEDTIVLPDLEKRVPGSTVENEEEHEMLEALVEVLKVQLDDLQVGDNPKKFIQYFMDFSSFHAKYLEHMLMEENKVLHVIWSNYSDEELAFQHHEIISSFTPEKILRWFRFIIPALNPTERFHALAGVKANAPKIFFDTLMAMVEEELNPLDYSRLTMDLLPVAPAVS
ncbi:hemerythrin domain-containing protein [Indibacter alkaliphilus]|uniref:hemerythrin domain-containing protein n=1 Tax=Indibacter alkaliphilus TaxID=579922 RepID=UPI00058EBC37|nr:hemerythrin domain-containing protein [Indibacter alkaliphilus]